MPTIAPPRADERTERAVAILHPRWSTWVLQTLAHAADTHLRAGEIARALPWIADGGVSRRLGILAQDGLVEAVTRRGKPGYALTAAGRALEPAHASLAAWSQKHLPHNNPVPAAEATEEALAVLRNRHTLPILQILRDRELVRFSELKEAITGIQDPLLAQRLHQLQHNGVIARTNGWRGHYALTDRARALEPTIGELTVWAHHHVASADVPATRTAANPTAATVLSAPSRAAARTAATGRSTVHAATFAVTFSHPGDALGPGAATPTAAGPRHGGIRR
ncbi:winged helix-turn-helix transcriptional regulator [Embleya sp. NPDC059237]|uniref:winged helix-turn-helix transcriptional regulator n=1 Tax=unclassified Embleya TaxID=2699296 RepID=UPI00369B7FD2